MRGRNDTFTDDLTRTFVRNLKRLRAKSGISTYRLAQLAGCAQGAISNIEVRRRRPMLETAVKIARALGVTVEEMLAE